MGELVSAISHLCKLLDCLVGTPLNFKPDYFRLSKLNKLGPEQKQIFWKVTHELCCFSATNEHCSGDSFKCIENYLQKQRGVAAYFLSPDATARQLLLCFGFILSERIIECNIDKVLMATPLGEELPSFMIESNDDDIVDTLVRPGKTDPEILLNYVLFISGKIKHNMRAVENYSQEKARLFSKVHQVTAGSRGPHMSVGDVLMTVRPELQSEFLSRSQHCVPLLQSYLRWRRKSGLFWEWMVSVVEEEFKTKPKQQSIAEITHLHEFLRRLKKDVQKAQTDEENETPVENHTPVTKRRLCLGKNSEVMDSLIKNMNLRINKLKMENETIVESIDRKLLETGKQCSEIKSILNMFCDGKSLNSELLKRPECELPVIDSLKINL